MFENFTVHNLRKLLSQFKRHHTIKNYHKMRKDKLVAEMNRQFVLHNNILYTKNVFREPVIHHHEEPAEVYFEPEPAPIFADDEVVEFNVGKYKNKTNKKDHISDEQADKLIEQRENVQRKKHVASQKEQMKKSLHNLHNQMKKDIAGYLKEYNEMNNRYKHELEQLKRLRQTKENKALYEQRIKQDVADKKALKTKYHNMFEYINKHKLHPSHPQLILSHIKERLKKLYNNFRCMMMIL
jgi:hypothetical protein